MSAVRLAGYAILFGLAAGVTLTVAAIVELAQRKLRWS